MPIRMLGAMLAGLSITLGSAATAADTAADFPSRPLRLLVGSPPGGSTDTYARIIAEPLGKVLGQNVVVENRTGASGIVATSAMLNSAADGYTLQFVYTSYTLAPSLYKDLPYDAGKDVAGVSMVVTSPLTLVVGASSSLASLDDVVKLSRKRSLNYGSAGVGSGGHLTAEMLRLSTGMPAVHVPYRGAAPAAAAVAAGDVDFAFVAQVTAKELMQAGKLRPLAVTSTRRTLMLPEVPTMLELGVKDYEFFNWFGVVAPARTSPAIVEKISRGIAQVLKNPDVRARLTSDGSDVVGNTPAEFSRFLQDDIRKSGELVRQIGIKQE
ncbi:tripartite tricarboxylate transporter substrate binding protein [Pigmentiphaga sp. H8]|uniref:tripartite tricarboxylate transporter substrate binding protein n=1 Tax=unclassified Pigmentiphaga TaxID=2626614 RepID=UPI000F5B518F|nr:tripartite tricarboxylate transporter substrate binding protein [Pigmentiphaga sp. H8]AZG11129.1 tripartite tricarboxylate transporter substrate binding protein [Pigmentiphaga sp. H8]